MHCFPINFYESLISRAAFAYSPPPKFSHWLTPSTVHLSGINLALCIFDYPTHWLEWLLARFQSVGNFPRGCACCCRGAVWPVRFQSTHSAASSPPLPSRTQIGVGYKIFRHLSRNHYHLGSTPRLGSRKSFFENRLFSNPLRPGSPQSVLATKFKIDCEAFILIHQYQF